MYDNAHLMTLLRKASTASPSERITYRDPIAEFGAAAIEPVATWIADPRLGAFAVRVLERIGQDPEHRQTVVHALSVGRASAATPRIATDIDEALDRMGVPHGRRRTGATSGGATRSDGTPGIPGRAYWAMHTWERTERGDDQRAYVWAELQRGRLRQGWGWDPSQDLRLIAAKLARGLELDGTERVAWRARRMLTDRDDAIHVDDIVAAVAVPQPSQVVFARVTGGYRFEPEPGIADYGHYLPVEIVAGPLERDDSRVSGALAAALRNRSRLWRIDPVGGGIEELVTKPG
jgi:hypothetical protein